MGFALAIVAALAAIAGLGSLVAGIVFATRRKRRGFLLIGLGIVLLVSVPIGYLVYVAVIIVCTGRSGAWIC